MGISFEFAQKQSTKKLEQKAYFGMVHSKDNEIVEFSDVTESHIQKIIREVHKSLCAGYSRDKAARKAAKDSKDDFDTEHTDLD